MQYTHDNIIYIFNCMYDPVVHLLLLKSFTPYPIELYDVRVCWCRIFRCVGCPQGRVSGGGRGHLGGKEKERESIDWVKGEDDSVEKEKTYKGNIY